MKTVSRVFSGGSPPNRKQFWRKQRERSERNAHFVKQEIRLPSGAKFTVCRPA